MKHGVTHRAMQERLAELNSRANHCSNQVLNLLDKQTQLSRDKETLGKEVRFLQSQVCTTQVENARLCSVPVNCFYCSFKGVVGRYALNNNTPHAANNRVQGSSKNDQKAFLLTSCSRDRRRRPAFFFVLLLHSRCGDPIKHEIAATVFTSGRVTSAPGGWIRRGSDFSRR